MFCHHLGENASAQASPVITQVKKHRENVAVGGTSCFVFSCFDGGGQGQPAAATVAPDSQ